MKRTVEDDTMLDVGEQGKVPLPKGSEVGINVVGLHYNRRFLQKLYSAVNIPSIYSSVLGRPERIQAIALP